MPPASTLPQPFAVLNIIKPIGLTSHDVVARLRKCYNMKRIGHLGTLDPLAEGVLPVCLGNATRLIEFFPSDKTYRAEITFGLTTTTLDSEGEMVTEMNASHLTPADLSAILPHFTGEIQQKVPMHSAVHVNGKKLYEYAHQGIEVETPTKTVTIHHIELVGGEGWGTPTPKAVIEVSCSTGTYVRALARDMGEQLHVGAYLTKLYRTRHGKFTQEEATPLNEILESSAPNQYMLNPAAYLGLPILELTDMDIRNRLCHGMKVPTQLLGEPEKVRLRGNDKCYVICQGEPVAVVQVVSRTMKPLKVFGEPVPEAQALEVVE